MVAHRRHEVCVRFEREARARLSKPRGDGDRMHAIGSALSARSFSTAGLSPKKPDSVTRDHVAKA
jgi:HD superfamily phosphodiesterase